MSEPCRYCGASEGEEHGLGCSVGGSSTEAAFANTGLPEAISTLTQWTAHAESIGDSHVSIPAKFAERVLVLLAAAPELEKAAPGLFDYRCASCGQRLKSVVQIDPGQSVLCAGCVPRAGQLAAAIYSCTVLSDYPPPWLQALVPRPISLVPEDLVELFRRELMKRFSDQLSMEQISECAHALAWEVVKSGRKP